MSQPIFSYLTGLAQNNTREWYHAHKPELKEATAEFETIIEDLILLLGKDDSRLLDLVPGDLTFRLTRDTRFSHDKSPYNPVFRCHISPAGKLPIPVGYFLFVCSGNRSFLGGGLFADMFTDATRRIRDEICSHPEEFLNIIQSPGFSDKFKVGGTSLKNVPKGYPADSPAAEYLKYKSWYLEFPFDDSLLSDPKTFTEYAAETFLLMKPFHAFLNRALEGFVMPAR